MKLASKLNTVCEELGASDLNRFWSFFEQHCLKATSATIKDSTLLLGDNALEIKFSQQKDDGIPDDLEAEVDEIGFTVRQGLKDLVSFVLNEYVLKDEESTEEDENTAIDFVIKKLKGHKVDFAGQGEIEHWDGEDHKSDETLELEGTGIIKDLKYDKEKDILTIDDFDLMKFTEVSSK